MGALHKDQYTFLIISRSFLLRMRNVPDEICRENQDTHMRFSNFIFPGNLAFYVIMWKNIVEPTGPQMTIWRMSIAGWMPEATDTFIICNIFCFSIATMARRKRLNITLYVHCLYCKTKTDYVFCAVRTGSLTRNIPRGGPLRTPEGDFL